MSFTRRLPSALVDPGSFRDPAGTVFHWEGRVFRAVDQEAAARLTQVLETSLLREWMGSGRMVPTTRVDLSCFPRTVLDSLPFEPSLVVEHARLPHISYPYEWPFSLLKRAAIHHLDLQLEALDANWVFVDASAYNVQFQGVRPVFIDPLSLRRYREGEYWQGYHQFCTQFLNPLLVTAKLGVAHGAWYRGAMEGIPIEDMAKLLGKSSLLSWNLLVHVFLHARMIERAARASRRGNQVNPPSRKLGKTALAGIMSGLRSFILGLKPKGLRDTYWSDYDARTPYDRGETAAKAQFVREYVAGRSPRLVWDIGCNAGYFSEQALRAGAGYVVGLDFDLGALEAAVSRADERKLNLTPLFLDVANPSPDQGWMQTERKGLAGRSTPDGLLALAVLHHLVIGKNIPLGQVVEWLLDTAPTGVVEFVPKGDAMVDGMLSRRDIPFDDYNLEHFRTCVARKAKIVREQVVSGSGRVLVEYGPSV